MKSRAYTVDWTDRSRDFSNLLFLTSFLLLLWHYTAAGAISAIVAEIFLTPHTIKCRSWTTGLISLIFVVASVCSLFGINP